MQTRRSFMGLLAAVVAGVALSKFNAPGIPGVTYFKAPDHDLVGMGKHLFFNGRNVMCEATEADLSQGWVRVWGVSERNPDGSAKCLIHEQHTLFGCVELRDIA